MRKSIHCCFVFLQVHVSNASKAADHCIVYSLSENAQASSFKSSCDHTHDEDCERCSSLHATLDEIIEKVKQTKYPSVDDHDEAQYIAESAKTAINSWKCHIMRSVNQDKARTDVLDLLDDESVLIVNDWAMKFLPRKYRESQTDWFGKRGISWHISVVYRRNKGTLQWQGLIHIIQSCSQGSPAVVLIMEDVLKTLKAEHPEIKKAYFRQDNAGCYHSNETITSTPKIVQSSGVEIVQIDFSDPQGGKGPADRLAATCKAHVRRFINEGNDVTTAEQLKEAISSYGGVEGVRVAAMESINETPLEITQKIPGISKLNNFAFHNNCKSVKTYRAYGIGNGNVISIESSNKGQ